MARFSVRSGCDLQTVAEVAAALEPAAGAACRGGLGPLDVSHHHDHDSALAVATAIRSEPAGTPATTVITARHRAPTAGEAVTSTAQIGSEVREVLPGLTSHASVAAIAAALDAIGVEAPGRS